MGLLLARDAFLQKTWKWSAHKQGLHPDSRRLRILCSEVAHFTPCRLCWYQRIAMYPLVPILGLAAWRRDVGIRPYALTLSITGKVISAYHVLLERYPQLESSVCEVANPCTLIWVKRLGYLTIPTMALSGFALITTMLCVARPHPAGARRAPSVSPRAPRTTRGRPRG